MRIKTVCALALLTCSFLTACATPVANETTSQSSIVVVNGEHTSGSDAEFVKTEYPMLLELRVDGYADMSIQAFRQNILELIDSDEMVYRAEMDRAVRDNRLARIRYSDEDAAFVLNTLIPISAGQWNSRKYGGSFDADSGMAEYAFVLTIMDADSLTVAEHSKVWQAVAAAVSNTLETAPEEKWSDEAAMQNLLESAVGTAISEAPPYLQVDIDYIDFMLNTPVGE